MKKQTKSDFRGAGRVSFLARKEVIQEMLDKGYPLTAIYKQHKGELNISYGQFTRYVQKYTRSKRNDDKERENHEPPGRAPGTVETVTANIQPSSQVNNEETPTRENKEGKGFRNDAEERAARDEDLF